MSQIHENSIKWLNEQLKKKYKTKTDKIVIEDDLKQCIYCPKLFLNSAFVIKHIFKRHAEQFLRHHKKCIDTTRTELGLDPETVLVNYLKREFSDIKFELEVVKKAIAQHTHVSDNTKNQVICPTGGRKCNGSDTNKLSLNNPEDFVENVTKEDFMKLQAKVEEVSEKYKEIVSSNKEMAALLEDRICKRLKKELMTDFENLLIHYQDQNSEWKSHLFQLKKNLNKLEQAVEMNAKKIESPEVLKEVEKKIDEQIKSFYENYGIFEERNKTTSKSIRKGPSDSPLNLNVHRANRRKKSIYTSRSLGPNILQNHLDTSVETNNPQLPANVPKTNVSRHRRPTSPWTHLDTSLKSNNQQLQENISESNNVHPIVKEYLDKMEKIGTRRAKALFVEKLKDFGMSLETRQMSAMEYETKKHLVDAQKEILCQKYSNFQQVYASLDSHANELVKSHMDRKFRKRLRFSDALNFEASQSKDKVLLEHEKEKSLSPVVKIISPFIHQSEFMPNSGACGDFNDEEDCEKPNSKCATNMTIGGVARKSTEGFKCQEHVAALPQNVALNTSFSEPKLINDPDKMLYHRPSIDHLKPIEEFSELSSLESDPNLSPNEFDES